MENRSSRGRESFDPAQDDVEAVTSAVLTASRALVAISARSLAAAHDTVTLPQFRALVVLATHGTVKLVTLAEELAVNPSTAMRMADRLLAVGLIDRQVNPDSRREVILRLTDGGARVVDDVTQRRRAEIAAVVARIPVDDRVGLVRALSVFAQASGEPSVGAATASPLGWQ